MAFSSSSHKTHHYCETPLEEADANDRDWLQLGLGLGFSTHHHQLTDPLVPQHQSTNPVSFPESISRSTQLQPEQVKKKHVGLGLGLELELRVGFETNECMRVREIAVAPPRNYHGCFWWQGQLDDDDDGEKCDDGNHLHHNMLSSWPWHMHQYTSGAFLGLHDDDDDDDDWQMPVPNHSHNCSTTTVITSRPHRSGLWFTLQSSINRDGEALPQIPKAYIRVKDENTTVFMVKKYLVTKLGLSNEAEIEIWCMEEKLSHTQTLKQVRDCVWLPRLVESVSSTSANMSLDNSQATSINHLMSLSYGKRCVLS